MLGAIGAFDLDGEGSNYEEQYGVFRDDYVTRDEYVEALNSARFDVSDDEEDELDIAFDETDLVIVCRVSRLGNGENAFYRSDNDTLCPEIKFSFQMETAVL